jgi:hypothetical protein
VVFAFALRARPARWVGETDDQLHAVGLGAGDDLVVLLPRRTIGFVAAIFKVALAMDLNVFPGKFLA